MRLARLLLIPVAAWFAACSQKPETDAELVARAGAPLMGLIRQDARVKECIRSQTPILNRTPNAEAAMDVEKIARRVMGLVENAKLKTARG